MKMTSTLLLSALCSLTSLTVYAGGTTAGGGNIAPEERVSEANIQFAVKNSKIFISSYINAAYSFEVTRKKGEYCNEVCELKGKILKSKQNFYDILNKTKIEVKNNDFCYDNLGSKKDGSMYGKQANAICISSYSLSKKLNINNYQNQITSLVFHELTHLAGTSENEAVILQNDLLAMLTKSPRRTVRELHHKTKVDIDFLIQNLSSSKSFLVNNTNGTCMFSNNIFEKLGSIEFDLTSTSDFNLLNPVSGNKFYSAYVKAFLLKSHLCANDNTISAEDREMEQMRIEYTFENKSSISTASAKFNSSKIADKNIYAKKITNANILDSEIEDISKLLTEVMSSLSNAMVRDFFETI